MAEREAWALAEPSDHQSPLPAHTLIAVMVCSLLIPGTTIAGVHELEKAGIRNAFINAVLAASQRADELSKL